MCVEDGNLLFLAHHAAWICNLSACTHRTPVRRTVDAWLPFPIALRGNCYSNLGRDNVIATLEHNHSVCDIELRDISSSLWEDVLTVMQEPFPIPTDLKFLFTDNMASVVPDSFLGGSTSRVRKLVLLRVLSSPGQLISRIPKLNAHDQEYVAFAIGAHLLSHFHGHMIDTSGWQSHAHSQISTFCLWHRFVTRPCPPFLRWSTSTSPTVEVRNDVGTMILRTQKD